MDRFECYCFRTASLCLVLYEIEREHYKARSEKKGEKAELFVSAKASSLLQPTQSSKATYLVLERCEAISISIVSIFFSCTPNNGV